MGSANFRGCEADPLTGHFTQADTLIPEPGKASAFDRYAYVLYNPIQYSDPSGHKEGGRCEGDFDCEEEPEEEKDCLIYGNCSKKDLNKIYSESGLDAYGITQDEFEAGYKSYQYVNIPKLVPLESRNSGMN